ncbi:hypothetical protein GT354_42565 [Streptomyces sp. SID3343]|nr:hypothetical protein [Streptomyces sp. SID3343]MYW04842.1 hypothetical protein [Streptomyces sp. SID3343]
MADYGERSLAGGSAGEDPRDAGGWEPDDSTAPWADVGPVVFDPAAGTHVGGSRGSSDPDRTAGGPDRERPRQAREGPIWREESELVARTFVQPMGYLRARGMMARHLLLLTGEPGSGKRTLALHLMQDQHVENVIAVDGVDNLMRLSIRRHTGYVIDGAASDGLAGYPPHELELLRQRLTERDSVLLVTCAVSARTPATWAPWRVHCQRPDPVQVLRSHLAHHLDRDWERRHLDLVDEDIVELVRTDGRPDHAASVACDLAEVARGRFTRNDVLSALRDRDHTAVEDWLREHPSYADWSFMIAAAVFEGHDYGVVTERATALRGLLTRRLPRSDDDAQDTWPPQPRAARLRSIHAVLDEDDVIRGRVRYRLDRVRFDRPHWGAAVRRHVWSGYPDLCDVLVDWLAQTPRRPAEVHRDAARAVGGFIAAGRGHQPLAPVGRWAREGGAKRPLAVLALRAAAQDPVVATQVRHLLELWSRERTRSDLRLTAALAYPGLASVYPGRTLSDLLKLARTGEQTVAFAARDSVVELCRDGMPAQAILELLESWEQAGAAAELTARLVWDDPSERILTSEVFEAVVRRVIDDSAGYAVVLRLFTALLATTETDPELATCLRSLFTALFRPGRGHGLERLAFDLTRLAHEGLPSGAVIDIAVLEPAIDAFEEPPAQPIGEHAHGT